MYLTRIRYNEYGWRKPSVVTWRSSSRAFTDMSGFGYEDWLFRFDWSISGWRYAFLQGVNDSYAKLNRARRSFDVALFSINPKTKERNYICIIRNAECLSPLQASQALSVYRARGWFETMQREIEAVRGDLKSLLHPAYTTSILNVRFREEDVIWLPRDMPVSSDSPLLKWNRYNLYSPRDHDLVQIEGELNTRLALERSRSSERLGITPTSLTPLITRQAIGETTYLPEHQMMQATLFDALQKEYPNARIVCEEHYVDITVETDEELILYEIKTDLNPRLVLRSAIGQLLEYSYNATQRAQAQSRHIKPTRLVAVGRAELTPEDSAYITQLNHIYHIPLSYRVVRLPEA